jgi:hypothetical protein
MIKGREREDSRNERSDKKGRDRRQENERLIKRRRNKVSAR